MSQKNKIIKGAFILTAAGFISRFMGFFYRIFLSRTFGEEGVGLYQLIFPVYTLIFSLTTAGIQTAISQQIGQLSASGRRQQMKSTLYAGLIISTAFSCICTLFIQQNASYIAVHLLGDSRCTDMLLVLAYVFPFSAVHSCICGYYYGTKNAALPALSQLLEQVVRIAAVYILYWFSISRGQQVNIVIAVGGLIFGEIASCICSVSVFAHNNVGAIHKKVNLSDTVSAIKGLLLFSTPLTLNRVLINLFQSLEAISIPGQLEAASHNTSQALSIYGVLTGMALPCIMFPSAITSSIAVLLVPTIAEVKSSDNVQKMKTIIRKVSFSCIFLGGLCWLFFLLFGNFIGVHLFHSTLAGRFILTLSWICPFLYLNTTLISTLNGLGKTLFTFLFHISSLSVRIIGVFWGIPLLGIQGYMYGLLLSQLTLTLLCVLYLNYYFKTFPTGKG
ncbi:MAG: polysaccharide biosynthesis protein [Hespellia sp.]|nr:polysaccharide biosynthesis protein [Hespellia sp.]